MNPRPAPCRTGPPALLALVAILALAPAARAGDSGPVDLRWRFEPGQVLRYELKQTSILEPVSSAGIGGREDELAVGFTWRVESVAEDGTATIAQSIDRVRAQVAAGPQSIVYDSESGRAEGPNAGALVELYGRVIRSTYRLKIDPSGEVVEAVSPRPVTEIIRSMGLGSLVDGGSLFSAEGLKTLLSQALPRLPTSPATVGSTWERQLEVPAGSLRLDLATVYTLASVEAQEARVDASIATAATALQVAGPGPTPAAPAVELGAASGRGDFRFDLSAGAPTRSTVEQEFRLALDPAGRRVERRFSIRMTLTRIDAAL